MPTRASSARSVRPRPGRAASAIVLALLVCGAVPAASAAAAPAKRLRVGSLVLRPCDDGTRWWCGTLPRRLDPARPAPRIGIDFRWLPAARAAAREPPIVAVEGGPGYPSTGTRVEYRASFGPLLRDRDLLLVDNRGTGTSALIDCKPLQAYTGVTSGPGFPRLVAGCAQQIERRYRRRGGPALHAADLFATAYAVADLAAIVRALRLGKVDLYGDSYGSFFAQSFISRHEELLHSVLLDSAYPVRGLDPWYASSGAVARRAMDAVCARDPGCAAAAPGSATARLAQLVARLREGTITGVTRDSDGSRVRVRLGIRTLVDMVQDATEEPITYRELDASVRAALAGDELPLLRLVAQSRSYLGGASPADYFSNGLYFAVACLDYPQPVSDADVFAPALGAAVRVITVPNTVHVESQGYTMLLTGARCVRRIIRSFVSAPRRLDSLDASCANRVPPIHTPGAYPLRLADASPATLVSGPDPGVEARRAVTVAAGALADATIRRFYSGAARGPGLRGGGFTARGDAVVQLTLRRVRFVRDALVGGSGSWRLSNGAVRGTLAVLLENDDVVWVRLSWKQRSRLAQARVGRSTLSLPAP